LNNTVYLIIVGNNANPMVNITLMQYQRPDPVITAPVQNETTPPDNSTTIIIYENITTKPEIIYIYVNATNSSDTVPSQIIQQYASNITINKTIPLFQEASP
jgi:hypothetical protein